MHHSFGVEAASYLTTPGRPGIGQAFLEVSVRGQEHETVGEVTVRWRFFLDSSLLVESLATTPFVKKHGT